MSERLSEFSKHQNKATLIRLQAVMDQYDLKRVHVARLLDVSRSLVSRWFAHHKKCPDKYPELLRSKMDIMGKDTIKDIISPK